MRSNSVGTPTRTVVRGSCGLWMIEVQDGVCLVGSKRQSAGDHLIEHDAERPYVGTRVDGLPASLLRAHVRRRAHDDRLACAIDRHGRRVGQITAGLGEPEIEHLDCGDAGRLPCRKCLVRYRGFATARALKHDVRRFEIAVHDAFGVGGFQRFANLQRDRERLMETERPTRDAMGQGLALHQLEHQEDRVAGFLEVVNRPDAWMVQRGEHARLAPEAREPVRIGGESLR